MKKISLSHMKIHDIFEKFAGKELLYCWPSGLPDSRLPPKEATVETTSDSLFFAIIPVGYATGPNDSLIFQFKGYEDCGVYRNDIMNGFANLIFIQEDLTHGGTASTVPKKYFWSTARRFYQPEVELVRPSHSKNDDPFPHVCPLCKSRAYVGFTHIECVGIGCDNYKTFKTM